VQHTPTTWLPQLQRLLLRRMVVLSRLVLTLEACSTIQVCRGRVLVHWEQAAISIVFLFPVQ